MTSNSSDELQLSKKHEEILGKRAVLLQQMEICYEQQKAKKKYRATMFQASRERNAEILQDFQRLEECLQKRPLLHPDVVNLQTRYWASVEQKLPEWESYLLGKSQVPMSVESPDRALIAMIKPALDDAEWRLDKCNHPDGRG